MTDIKSIVNQTQLSNSIGDGKFTENSSTTTSSTPENSGGEKNRTDPKVCHDPSISLEKIVREHFSQNKVNMEEHEYSTNNEYDFTRTDGIEYPLVAINNRNIENDDILYMNIDYYSFLPKITITIHDERQTEQKLFTTQMSSIIRTCIIAKVDKVYKKILLNFRTYDVKINEANPIYVTYYGIYYVPEFRQINMKHIWMPAVCGAKNCGQGAHINANTWEMLHRIAEMTGLGFAATKMCKEIPDHLIRNIYSQRYDQYIEQQLLHCGTDEDNLFDAWVDLYGYIVMVNVPWVMNEDIKPNDLDIVMNYGVHGTSNNTPEQDLKTVSRTLTNYNLVGTVTNMEISAYNMVVDNNSIKHGTLEQAYSVNFDVNLAKYDIVDIQSKQNSIDGEYLEDYNTGKNRPIPKFNFNDDAWTGLSGGYDIHRQKITRNAYFRKKRQSIFNVELKNVNLGLQRGTLVHIVIFDSDPLNKKRYLQNIENLQGPTDNIQQPNIGLPKEYNEEDLILDDGAMFPNYKLSGLYYIDGMKFEYSKEHSRIIQTLFLIKKEDTSGYYNRHNPVRVPADKVKAKGTLAQSPPFIETNDIY